MTTPKIHSLEDTAKVFHRSILIAKRQQREQAAKSATITTENRNLSVEWSK